MEKHFPLLAVWFHQQETDVGKKKRIRVSFRCRNCLMAEEVWCSMIVILKEGGVLEGKG